jgi:adenosylmethionine-8-amino-7-oxononanoate aminotransferase
MSKSAPERKTVPHAWFAQGLPHVWLPYAQMKTAAPPLPAVRTEGCRITLADGRELIDGIASWWTACHGYNHPHIREAVTRQLATMPHVMFGGLVHEQALTWPSGSRGCCRTISTAFSSPNPVRFRWKSR